MSLKISETMKRDILDRWIDDLESREFEQTTGVLDKTVFTGDVEQHSYCCLGVLAFRLVEDGIAERDGGTYGPCGFVEDEHYVSDTELAPDLLKETGLTTQQQSLLIEANDDAGLNFQQIAWMIRKGLI